MDAAQTNTKKIAFFLATALLLTAPFHASAQALVVSSNSIAIGSASCNDFQTVQVTSSTATPISFTVTTLYNVDNGANGQWLYTRLSGPATAGTTGVGLTIGRNLSISPVTDTANVVLTDTGNSADTVTIQVNYQQNNSCGGSGGSTSNNTIQVTPGSISLTAGTNGQASQSVSIQNLTGISTSVGLSVQPVNSWLVVSATSLTLAANGATSVNVTATSAAVTTSGTQTGYLNVSSGSGLLTIQVTFVPNGGTGTGTGTGGTLTLGPGATSNNYTDPSAFNVVLPSYPSAQCIPIQDTAGVNTYNYTATSTGNWLLANYNLSGTEFGNLAPGANACVTVSVDPNVAKGLASGAYQGSVTINSDSGSSGTITVNMYLSAGVGPGITVSPGAIYTFPNIAVNNSNPQQSVLFTVTPASGYSLGTALLTSSANGFSITTPNFSGNIESFLVTANTSGLAAGIYTTTVTISSSGPQSGATTITIVQPVGQAGTTCTNCGTTVTSLIEPLSLTFQEQQGTSFWTGGQEAQAITITGQQGTSWSASIAYISGSGWLNLDSPQGGSGTFGSGPATLMVDLYNSVSSLAPGTYTAQVTITTPSGNTVVPVTLTVSNTAVLLGLPASATFSSNGGIVPSSQTIRVVGSDNTGSTSSPLISVGAPSATWISATASGNTMTISVNPSTLNTGVYSGTVPVTASPYAAALQYPVVVVVNGGTGSSGPLTLSPASLPFTNVTGQISQNLTVSASSATTFTVGTPSETNCTNASWLQVATGTYTTNTSVSVTVNPSGIANGTVCTGVITLTSTTTQTVNVSMTVGSATGSGNVTVSPLSMSFAYTQSQSLPAAQTATIVNVNSGTAGIPFTVTTAETSGTSVTWLSTAVTSGSTPYNSPGLSVSVAPGSLNPGTYQGTVTIAPTGGTAQAINVTLTVTGNAVVSATPTTLSMTYQVGGASPTAAIQVSGNGTASGFTATAASSAGWLQVSPTSGTTTNTGTVPLTASVVSSVLSTLSPAGSPYTGTITVAGTSPATGSTTVNVTLTVTAPLPVINLITSAASGASGPVSPGELISLYAPTTTNNPIGPASQNLLTLDSTGKVSTSLGGVQVEFLPIGVYAPLTYVNAGQINAVVPYEVAGLSSVSVEVKYLGQTSNAFPLNVAATAPGIFTANFGTGQAAAIQYDTAGNYQGINSPSKPASKGWLLAIYMTGEGVVNPPAVTGSVTKSGTLPQPYYVPTVLIGGQPATIPAGAYGEVAGLVSGVLQVNAFVPAGAGTGAVSLSISLGSAATQAGVTVYLQ